MFKRYFNDRSGDKESARVFGVITLVFRGDFGDLRSGLSEKEHNNLERKERLVELVSLEINWLDETLNFCNIM